MPLRLARRRPTTTTRPGPTKLPPPKPRVGPWWLPGRRPTRGGPAASDDAGTDEAITETGHRPPLVAFHPPAATPAPPLDAYSFRLVATRKLYDQGTIVQASPSLAALAPETFARIHPSDAERLGVVGGDRVVVRSARSSLTLAVEPDAGVPRGAVALVVNQADARVGDLISVDEPVNELRIETAR